MLQRPLCMCRTGVSTLGLPFSPSKPPVSLLGYDNAGGMVYTGAAYSTGELRVPSPGEGLLRFWTCRFGSAPQLSFSSGAAFRDTNAREERTLFEAALPAGGAELVWRAEQGGTFSLNSYLAIDHVEFIPYADVSLAEALDTPGRMRAKMRVSRASSTGWVNMHIVPAL